MEMNFKKLLVPQLSLICEVDLYYYYTNTTHQALIKSFIRLNYGLFDIATLFGVKIKKPTKQEIDDIIYNKFSYKQQFYVNNLNNGNFRTLIEHSIYYNKLKTYFESCDIEKSLKIIENDKKKKNLFSGVLENMDLLVKLCDKVSNVLSDPSNKSSTISSIISFNGYTKEKSSSITEFNNFIEMYDKIIIN